MKKDILLTGDNVCYNGDNNSWEIYFNNVETEQIPVYARAKMQGKGQPIYNIMLVKVKFYKKQALYFCEYKDM